MKPTRFLFFFFITLLILFLLFSWIKFTYAYTLEQTTANTLSQTWSWSSRVHLIQTTENFNLTPQQGFQAIFKLNEYTTNAWEDIMVQCDQGYRLIWSHQGVSYSTSTWTGTPPNLTLTIDVNDTWWNYGGAGECQNPRNWVWDLNYDAGTRKIWGSNTDYYPGYDAHWENNYWQDQGSDSQIEDIYFILSQGYGNNIIINYPEDSASVPDFDNWVISWTTPTPTSTYIGVRYGVSTSTWQHHDELSNPLTENEYNNYELSKNWWFDEGHYYAQAYLQQITEDYSEFYDTATSTIIEFDIISTHEPIYFIPMPTSTATSSQWVITCDPESGFFSYSICYVIQYLFMPSPAAYQQFSSLGVLVSQKAPIGYFYRLKEAFENISSTSTPAFTIETGGPALDTPVYNPLKTGFAFILWLFFGVNMFRRIKNLEL